MYKLFKSFFKIGLITFGGGMAMLPLIEEEVVNRYGWFTRKEFLEIAALSQITPGPIATSIATFVGQKHKGFLGALVALFAVLLPSFFCIYFIALFFTHSFTNPIVSKALIGIRIGLTAIILKAVIKMIRGLSDLVSFFIFFISLTLLIFHVDPVYLIIMGIFLGLIIYVPFYNSHFKKREK